MSSEFDSLVQTVHRLRAPGGCPWDRAQTHQSLRPYLIEEAYEVLEVLDKISDAQDLADPKIRADFLEELGDLWMQVLIHSEIAHEAGAFSIQDVAAGLRDKLVRRHPHVFGTDKADSPDAALKNWERQKSEEKANKGGTSVLEGLPKSLPALQRATRAIEKVSKVGFQWKDLEGPLDKVHEEMTELNQAITQGNASEITHELGDVLFSICNLAFHLKSNPENALRACLERFEKRFRFVENELSALGKTPEQSTLEEMDKLWEKAKQSLD